MTKKTWRNNAGALHRLDGPAVINEDRSQQWWVNGTMADGDLISWIKDNNIPFDYRQWTDIHKVLFRIRF